ncbi:phosphoenolpyruvate synthase [Natronincola peptidivorans]|uniref:Rifampicin phosphotransferase n=1 Tax=Natronincola peptidivorans TaxID=426128 RepID=A0A1I0DR50_9FIRM|nr:phosphoenolpyruvate synthase [Natronincola peptidivorans]SET35043.1 phosphoenolpyruvate synthase [Natronincola peptidivorans]
MKSYVLGFQELDKNKLMIVGGKGANLGELSRIEGIRVPEGFCITTEAYKRIIDNNEEFNALLDQLSVLKLEDRGKIAEISGKIRKVIEEIVIPEEIALVITGYVSTLGEENAYAVRSSATAEDLPTASFAGQQDTYLNIIGKEAILQHVSKCWASLFTERAITYRIQNDFDHRKVYLSVVIQRMILPEAAGILFTADPVNSNRKVLSIDASFGIGEALVSGIVNADIYKVREGSIIDKKIPTKKLGIYALKEGGTEEREIVGDQQNKQTLTDDQILELEQMGRKIEAHFGYPQDIEWCLYEGEFYIVQSRPITTIYPIPEVKDGKNHVYISYGHRQMMTDAMKPLGLTFFQMFFRRFGGVVVEEAGGRMFMDVSHELRSQIKAKILLGSIAKVDILMENALRNVMKRKDFIKSLPSGKSMMSAGSGIGGGLMDAIKFYSKNDPSIVTNLIAKSEDRLHKREEIMSHLSGSDLFDFIDKDMDEFKKAVTNGYGAYFVAMYASDWLNKRMEKWLGEKNVADTLSQSVKNNVTSEMGLELLDVADVARQYPEVMEYFTHANDETFFQDLSKLMGGKEVSEVMESYLKKYGMRCTGETDISRPRWNEKPTTLIAAIMGYVKNFQTGEHKRKFEKDFAEAQGMAENLLSRLENLPGGKKKTQKIEKMISVLRNFAGYREYNKYMLVWYFWIIKQSFLREADKLVKQGSIQDREDIYFLTYDEFKEAVQSGGVDYDRISKRKEEHAYNEKLSPPRVITSEGEVIFGEYTKGNIPKDALAGVAVSSGIIEGRARVLTKIDDAHIEKGDILVATYTDPSWTPLFVSVSGLVTEIGGMMTHGAVVAREYGMPAVAGVDNATKLIKDGQRIRINGNEGYIEILD